jgi:hypothetical protein
MDQETLTNHISRLSESLFEIACKIVLRDVFNLNTINVDGRDDGGTDFLSVDKNGGRIPAAYQITTQRSDIKNKAYRDAKKSITKLGVSRFFFMTTINLSETESRKIESNISNEIGVSSTCFGSNHISGFLISEHLLNKFLDEANYPLPRQMSSSEFDYCEMALHSYTLISKDAYTMKEGIYDDTILFNLSESQGPLTEQDLIQKVVSFLGLSELKYETIKRRIGSLFGRQMLKRTPDLKIELSPSVLDALNARKRLYENELINLASSQIDIMRNDFQIDWTLIDSKMISINIADAYINSRIASLKEVKAGIVSNGLFHAEDRGIDSIRKYLLKLKKLPKEKVDDAIEKLLDIASNHPLITKLARASIYVALEGSNPISSAKALGANRWSDFNCLVEPTVAIPWICSRLYKGYVNKSFDYSIKALERASELDIRLHIPYFYMIECAGHLLRARHYNGLNFSENELQFSPNAFISNYYALKKQGINVPDGIMNYLRTFSPSILVERTNTKEWVRAIMTDISSTLTGSGVEFVEVPYYDHDSCAAFEKDYMYFVNERNLDKPPHLMKHDIWALQFTHDSVKQKGEHWLILTYDRAMIDVYRNGAFSGWITNPYSFLDMTQCEKQMSETSYVTLMHSIATYSEKTLSAGSRIIDRVVQYASREMQNWEFKQDVDNFKKEVLETVDLNSQNAMHEIDCKTDDFLKSRNINIKIKEEEVADTSV